MKADPTPVVYWCQSRRSPDIFYAYIPFGGRRRRSYSSAKHEPIKSEITLGEALRGLPLIIGFGAAVAALVAAFLGLVAAVIVDGREPKPEAVPQTAVEVTYTADTPVLPQPCTRCATPTTRIICDGCRQGMGIA